MNETFACHSKPGASSGEIIAGVNWACATAKVEIAGCEATDDEAKLAHASQIFDGYFAEYHTSGATCDFGGAAELSDESAAAASQQRSAKGGVSALPTLQLFRGQVPLGLHGTHADERAQGPTVAMPWSLAAVGVVLFAGFAAQSMRTRRRRALARRDALDAAGLREELVPAARCLAGAPHLCVEAHSHSGFSPDSH